jgi:peptidoglycan/LPS O-acetylase OafA/YrhL
MGMLRFFLALSVLFSHADVFLGFVLGNGRIAVQAFYMISGFYMAFVWTEKYSKMPNPIWSFYISRALRIYPLYFFILGGLLLMGFVFGSRSPEAFHFVEAFNKLGLIKAAGVYLTQFTLIGMEIPLFIDFQLHKYMIIPVAWTLGLELTFYLLVPFMLSRMYFLVGIFLISMVVRVLVTVYANMDPLKEALWTYRFFPFEIALFLAGTFSYYLLVQLPSKLKIIFTRNYVYFITLTINIGYLCCFELLKPRLGEATYWFYYLLVFISIAILFQYTKNSNRDTYIGDLSYPIYLSHIPILWVTAFYFPPSTRIYYAIPLTLVASILLSRLQCFVDDYRHNLIRTKTD